MSLHLGNLPPRIRKDELENIFKRFGRCTVQVKDGYGFAVFDFRGDAEKALRTLKGRKICGERIYLSWSNKQPKPLQSLSRAGRSRYVQYRRTSGRIDNNSGRNLFRNRGEYTMSDNRPGDGGARNKTVEVCGDSFNPDSMEPEHCHQKEDFVEEDGYIEFNKIDAGKWSERVDNLGNVNGDDEEMGFNRYEPNCVDERGEEYENRNLGHTEASSYGEILLDKSNRVHDADSGKGHYTCYKCGAAGHKMRDCPLKDALHRKRLFHSGHRHEKETNSKSRERGGDRGESRSRRRLQPSSGNFRSARRHGSDGEPSQSERNGTNDRSSPLDNETNRTKRKGYNGERQREREDQVGEMHDDKKSKRLPFSHHHSDHTSPQLGTYSRSVKPSSYSISRSRSGSPLQRYLSAMSRSNKSSNRSRSRSIKSKSRSGSSSPLSSLSTPLGKSLPSSPNREETNLNGSFAGAPNAQFTEKLTEVWQESETQLGDEKISTGSKAEGGLSGYVADSTHQLEEALIERRQLGLDLEDEKATSINHSEVCLNGSLNALIPQSQQLMVRERQQSEPESRRNSLQIGDEPVQSEDFSAFEMRDDVKINQSHNEDGSNSIVPLVSCEIKSPCPSSVEQGGRDTTPGKSSAEKQKEADEFQCGNGLEMMKSPETAYELDPEGPSKAHVGSHIRISGEELCKVLKHYGLKHPVGDEEKLGVEDYFGSARMWPWALIYYRRLKKGPVSTENYARRVAQNKAFGITDKYVRSSSGWGELTEDH